MHHNTAPLLTRRRQPRQHRSRLMVASIREACLRILREGEATDLSVSRIAELAGVAIGSFYQYYSNKEALLLDVLLEQAPGEAERIADETRHIQRLRRESLALTLRELVHLTCERHQRLLELHGPIYRRHHRAIDFNALVKASVSRYVAITSWDDWMLQLLHEHRASLAVESLERAAFLIAGTIVEMSARAVDLHPECLASAAFREDLLRMLLGYLQPMPPATS